MRRKLELAPAALAASAAAALVVAVALVDAPAARAGGFELGLEGASLSDGQSDWVGTRARAEVPLSPTNLLTGELDFARRFDETAALLTAGFQHDYDEDSYQVFSITGSSGGLFWPSGGAVTEYFRKLGGHRAFVLGAGAGYLTYRTATSDAQGILEAVYYFQGAPWVLEAGWRGNLAQPGAVGSNRGFAALTWLPVEGMQLIAKLDGGNEAYQLVGNETVETSFKSVSAGLEAIVPLGGIGSLGAGRSLHVSVERYGNPFYARWTGYLGISQGF
jgi:YaiO family outer membrane protein